ncbi:MAG: hypothetical protein RLZZ234_251, partial [Candidatus Parcubacteria bacterium]
IDTEKPNLWTITTQYFNYTSYIFSIIGLVLMVAFGVANVSH